MIWDVLHQHPIDYKRLRLTHKSRHGCPKRSGYVIHPVVVCPEHIAIGYLIEFHILYFITTLTRNDIPKVTDEMTDATSQMSI